MKKAPTFLVVGLGCDTTARDTRGLWLCRSSTTPVQVAGRRTEGRRVNGRLPHRLCSRKVCWRSRAPGLVARGPLYGGVGGESPIAIRIPNTLPITPSPYHPSIFSPRTAIYDLIQPFQA